MALALGVVGCGGEGGDEDVGGGEAVDAIQARQIAEVEAAIRDGRLPPVARSIVQEDGTMRVDFVDGGTYDEDVVRTEGGGERGPRLRWDFDGDGRILGNERRVTERFLYHQVLAVAPPVE